jgi:hypothetical protein
LLYESYDAQGALNRTLLERSRDRVWLLHQSSDGIVQDLALPEGSVTAVMRRYAKPLDGSLLDRASGGEHLLLPDGQRLTRARFRPHYDVIAKDYLVLWTPDGDPVAELATTVSAALLHLGRALSQRRLNR